VTVKRDRGQAQVNVTLTSEEYDLLVSLAFVEERSASELLRPAVTALLDEEGSAPEVQQALQARRARRDGKLAGLRDRIRKNSG
jgi:hypothetical protein